jgi:hypothetical protein
LYDGRLSKRKSPVVTRAVEKHGYPLRVLVAVAIVEALVLAATVNLGRYFAVSAQDPFAVDAQLERMRGAAAAIPAGATVGYVSDTPINDPTAEAFFDIARYALAPRPLLLSPDGGRAEWVLGCFLRPYQSAAFAAQHGLTVATDYRNGVVVFRRAK